MLHKNRTGAALLTLSLAISPAFFAGAQTAPTAPQPTPPRTIAGAPPASSS